MSKINVFTEGGTIYFHATNIEEFKELIGLAEEQAQQLNETVTRLKHFKFQFKFTENEQSKD